LENLNPSIQEFCFGIVNGFEMEEVVCVDRKNTENANKNNVAQSMILQYCIAINHYLLASSKIPHTFHFSHTPPEAGTLGWILGFIFSKSLYKSLPLTIFSLPHQPPRLIPQSPSTASISSTQSNFQTPTCPSGKTKKKFTHVSCPIHSEISTTSTRVTSGSVTSRPFHL